MHETPIAQSSEAPAQRDQARLARDVHDVVSQALFAANLVAGTLARDPALPAAARAQVQTLERLNRGALAELRLLRFELEPGALHHTPLAELLRDAAAALAARAALQLTSRIDALEPPPPAQVLVYRVAQEALANVARHSRAHHAHLAWTGCAPRRARLVVQDDGQGFDKAAALSMHAGLHKMQAHARELSTEVAVRSARGAGTRIEMEVGWR